MYLFMFLQELPPSKEESGDDKDEDSSKGDDHESKREMGIKKTPENKEVVLTKCEEPERSEMQVLV